MVKLFLRALFVFISCLLFVGNTPAESSNLSIDNITLLRVNAVQYSDGMNLTEAEKTQIENLFKQNITGIPPTIIWPFDAFCTVGENVGLLTIYVNASGHKAEQNISYSATNISHEELEVKFTLSDINGNIFWSSSRSKSISKESSIDIGGFPPNSRIPIERTNASADKIIAFCEVAAKDFPKQYNKAVENSLKIKKKLESKAK